MAGTSLFGARRGWCHLAFEISMRVSLLPGLCSSVGLRVGLDAVIRTEQLAGERGDGLQW